MTPRTNVCCAPADQAKHRHQPVALDCIPERATTGVRWNCRPGSASSITLLDHRRASLRRRRGLAGPDGIDRGCAVCLSPVGRAALASLGGNTTRRRMFRGCDVWTLVFRNITIYVLSDWIHGHYIMYLIVKCALNKLQAPRWAEIDQEDDASQNPNRQSIQAPRMHWTEYILKTDRG